ncbi:TPA: conjugal transfer protein TraL [Aeromonas hydrophila]|nr:conjugal transfer protein TraL [Salmonella enterica]EDU1178451.1 conjugal transfer protein TraL [Salmonella enterica subsp. enterica serovar Java]MDK6410372.1 conjugal transfer protein TraL [Escherichia coli]HAT2250363.1 conjugal transfer protein TraL [Aeromonas hydrophila]EHE9055815.1 conjugal transfer protein TraL [Salmonella enterica]
MKNAAKAVVLMALFGVTTSMISPSVQAASEDECAIWLCLPGGFPSGCGGAKSAMLKRVKKGKSPLPDFVSCAVKGDSGGSSMTYDYNYAAAIQEQRVCKRYTGNHNNSRCVEWETVPAHYQKGKVCTINNQTGNRTPRGCTSTYRYVDVFIDGALAGDTYFWR